MVYITFGHVVNKAEPINKRPMSIFDRIFNSNRADRQTPLDTTLINAIVANNIYKVFQAINAGANPNSFDRNSLSAILIASSKQQVKVVDALIKKGAYINAKGTDKKQQIFNLSPLIAASANGNIDIVKLLLEANANIDITDDRGLTPLMAASQHGFNDVIKALLVYGADIYFKGNYGMNAIDLAKQNSMAETIELLESN